MGATKLAKRLAGVPGGGSTGQVLKKLSNSDYDYTWANDALSSTVMPPGTYLDFATTVLPAGFLAGDGGIYATSLYSDLYSALGILHSVNIYISDAANSVLKYDRTTKPWLNPIDTGSQVVNVPVRIGVYNGTYPNTTDSATDYWIRYSTWPMAADPSFTLHSTQADALANTGKILLTDGTFGGANASACIEKSGYFRVPNLMYDGGLFRRAWSSSGAMKLGAYKPDTMIAHNHFTVRAGSANASVGNAGYALAQASISGNYYYEYTLKGFAGVEPNIAPSSTVGGDETVPMHMSVLVGVKT